MLFLDISRAQNGFLFVLRIETGTHKATFRTVNMVGDTIISPGALKSGVFSINPSIKAVKLDYGSGSPTPRFRFPFKSLSIPFRFAFDSLMFHSSRSLFIVSPTVLTAPGREQNCCFLTYLALKTAFYSFSGSKQALIKRLSEPSTWLGTL